MSADRRRAVVLRVGALGDVLLTRRLTYSLYLAGLRSTLFAPIRHASLLLQDPWVDAVLDSESRRFSGAFTGTWPLDQAGFEVGVVISQSVDLAFATESAATSVIQIPPGPSRDDESIAQQWADAAHASCTPFTGSLPCLATDLSKALVPGATLIHPGSGSPRKNWPMERFVELGRSLKGQGHRIVWIRGPAETDFPLKLSDAPVLDQPSLEVLSATLARSKVFIGNDSGVAHLAAAVGAPTVALFGPTNDIVWRPDGLHVQTVRSPPGELVAIRVEDVLAAIDALARLA